MDQTANQSLLKTNGSRYEVVDENELEHENHSVDGEVTKMDVTLIDAFKIKEINLLIASYVFSMCHNLQILQSRLYSGIVLDDFWFQIGSIGGVFISGVLVDLVFKKRLFLTILMLNIPIFGFDIYLFTQDFSTQ